MLDASVAAKWWLAGKEEQLRDEALDLLKRYVEGEIRFIVPDLFWPELGNIFGKPCDNGDGRGHWRRRP